MKMTIQDPVRLVAKRTIKTKKGQDMTFANIANKTTFETLETALRLYDGQSADELVENRDYHAVVDYDGKWGSIMLMPLPAAGK
jgi:cyanate lyase